MNWVGADITLEVDERNAERVIAQAQGEEAMEFVDGYLGPMLEVLDSGRIVIPREAGVDFTTEARKAGLTVDMGAI